MGDNTEVSVDQDIGESRSAASEVILPSFATWDKDVVSELFHRVLTIFVHVSAVSNSSFMLLFYIHRVLVRSYPTDKSLALFLHVNQAGFPIFFSNDRS